MARSMEKPRTMDDVTDKAKPWQLAEIVDPTQCRLVAMPDSTDGAHKVRLTSSTSHMCGGKIHLLNDD